MKNSRLFCAAFACVITFFSASTFASKDVVHITKNSTHSLAVEYIVSGYNHFKHGSNAYIISSIENTALIICAGLLGVFLLRKANQG